MAGYTKDNKPSNDIVVEGMVCITIIIYFACMECIRYLSHICLFIYLLKKCYEITEEKGETITQIYNIKSIIYNLDLIMKSII